VLKDIAAIGIFLDMVTDECGSGRVRDVVDHGSTAGVLSSKERVLAADIGKIEIGLATLGVLGQPVPAGDGLEAQRIGHIVEIDLGQSCR
jgi:hypothetical protein